MHGRSLITHLVAVGISIGVVSAVDCGPGMYRSTADSQCYYCPPGTYNNQPNPPQCTAAQAGWKACGPQIVGGFSCFGATQMIQCGQGMYTLIVGQSQCNPCPPGHKCPSDTTTQPQACSPGQYQETSGGGQNGCPGCPKGQYNNAYGATKCCKCCAGTYNDQTHQTHCQLCPNQTPFSDVGADSTAKCFIQVIPGVISNTICKDTLPPGGYAIGQGYCLPEQGPGGPANTIRINKRRSLNCARGLTRCLHLSGKGGFDCVNTQSDPESCGGCVSINGDEGDGQDCTAIPNVSITRCVRGKCVIKSCAKRHVLSDDGTSCEPINQNLQSQRRRRDAVLIHPPASHRHLDV